MAEKTLEVQNTLVRYNNPTLVIKHDDKKGDKEVKIKIFKSVTKLNEFFLRKFLRALKMEQSETLAKKLKRFLIQFCHHVVGKKTVSFGVKQFQARLLLVKMSSIFKKCSTLVCSKAKHEKLEFVRFAENFTANALVIFREFDLLLFPNFAFYI